MKISQFYLYIHFPISVIFTIILSVKQKSLDVGWLNATVQVLLAGLIMSSAGI